MARRKKGGLNELQKFLFKENHRLLGGETLFNHLRDMARILLQHKKSKFFCSEDLNNLPGEVIFEKVQKIEGFLSFYTNARKPITRKTMQKYKKELLLAIRYKLEVDHKMPRRNAVCKVMENTFNQLFKELYNST